MQNLVRRSSSSGSPLRGSSLALLVACLGSLAVGCGSSGGPDAEGLGQTQAALDANDKTAFDYFLAHGLKNFQAAGIVGNLDQESGDDPMSMQSGGPGRGIAQWSVGGRWDTEQGDNATWYAGTKNESVWSLGLQLDFIWFELNNFSSYGLSSLEQSTNVTDATVAFQTDFEGCGVCDQSNRVTYAQQALAAYGSDVVDASATMVSGDAGANEDSGTSCFVPSLNMTGECILTSACAAMPDHVSTAGYCPGPSDVECCTGPSVSPTDSGMTTGPTDSGSAPDTSTGTVDSSTGPMKVDSGTTTEDSGASGTKEDAGHGSPTTKPPTSGPEEEKPGSKGCAVTPAGSPAPSADWWLLGLSFVALRGVRRKKR